MSSPIASDFPDRLSPMLVKELRQGLRAKTFIAVFLSLQAILLVILLTATASDASANAGSVISNVIFSFFALAVLAIQPLRGIGAISSEVKGNTIDMMVLTRLSARRIVYGKWFALVSQSALILSTIIPYLIFRYFFGQMNLFAEIVFLLLIFSTSIAITAVTVGLSGSNSVILRALLPILAVPVLAYMSLFAIFSAGFGTGISEITSLTDAKSRIIVGSYLLLIAYIGWSFLSLGISFIAPAVENHSTPRRLIALAILVLAGILISYYSTMERFFVPVIFFLLASPPIAIALTERSELPGGVRSPVARFGPLGKILSPLLSPGWPSGVFFTILLSAVYLAFAFTNTLFIGWSDGHRIAMLGLLGGLLFPAVILILFRTDESSRFSNYMLILIGSAIFTLLVYAVTESLRNDDLLWFFIWCPFIFLPIAEEHASISEQSLVVASLVVAGYLAALACLAVGSIMRRNRPVTDKSAS